METLRSYLKGAGIENVFDEKEILRIKIITLKDGGYLYTAENLIRYFYILLEGGLKVTSLSKAGKVNTIAYLQPYDVVGELELLDSRRSCICDIVSKGDSTLLEIPFEMAKSKIRNDIKFLSFISTNLANKNLKNSEKSIETHSKPLKKKILLYFQRNSKDGHSAEEVANYLGITGRHVRRVLNEMVLKGDFYKEGSLFYLKR